jgi:hypothetical protein
MKKTVLFLLSLTLTLPLFAQFKAKMFFSHMGKNHVFTIYSSDAGYRYEFKENGQEGVIISKTGTPDIYILMPQQKMAMKSSASNKMNMGNDPVASYRYFLSRGNLKTEGNETINGIQCTRSGLYSNENSNQKLYTVWISDTYDFPIKMINHIDGTPDGSLMEIKEIEGWTPTSESYEVPEGYQVMDMPGMPGQ